MADLAALSRLSDQLGAPGEARLFTAARRQGINVTRRDVRGFVATQGQRQLFRPLQRPEGKSATDGHGDRYQMDLGQLNDKMFLLVVSVFSRKAWARPVRNKAPATVAPVLDQIIDDIPHPPGVISSDMGLEFTNEVDRLLSDQYGIVHKVKAKGDPNALAVQDRAMQKIKQTMARLLAQRGDAAPLRAEGAFATVLAEAVRAHNETVNETVRDTPNDVDAKNTEAGKVLGFMAMRDNAKKFQHNNQLTKRRKEKLEEAGAFRRPLRGLTKFARSFHATYGDIETARRPDGSLAIESGTMVKGAANEPAIDIKRVQVVPTGSSAAQAVLQGTNPRDETRRRNARELMEQLLDFLQGQERSLEAAALHLREVMGSSDYQAALSGRRLSQIIALFPEEFELTRNNYFVRPL